MLLVRHFILELRFLHDSEHSLFEDIQILRKEFANFIDTYNPDKDYGFDIKVFQKVREGLNLRDRELLFFIATSVLNDRVKKFEAASNIECGGFDQMDGFFVVTNGKK